MIFFSLRPEEKIRTTEKKIMGLIETSAQAVSENNMKIALERAREASSRERALIRLQEQAGLSDNHNIDLTFAVSSLNYYNLLHCDFLYQWSDLVATLIRVDGLSSPPCCLHLNNKSRVYARIKRIMLCLRSDTMMESHFLNVACSKYKNFFF